MKRIMIIIFIAAIIVGVACLTACNQTSDAADTLSSATVQNEQPLNGQENDGERPTPPDFGDRQQGQMTPPDWSVEGEPFGDAQQGQMPEQDDNGEMPTPPDFGQQGRFGFGGEQMTPPEMGDNSEMLTPPDFEQGKGGQMTPPDGEQNGQMPPLGMDGLGFGPRQDRGGRMQPPTEQHGPDFDSDEQQQEQEEGEPLETDQEDSASLTSTNV